MGKQEYCDEDDEDYSITYFPFLWFYWTTVGVLTVFLFFWADSGAKGSDGEFSSNDATIDGSKDSTGSIKRKKHAKKVRWKENEIGKELLTAWYHSSPSS